MELREEFDGFESQAKAIAKKIIRQTAFPAPESANVVFESVASRALHSDTNWQPDI